MSRTIEQFQPMTSRVGAVAGCVGDACGGGNISRQRVKIAAGGRKKRRGGRHRGGAYGVVKADPLFGRGYASINPVDTCSPSGQAGGYNLVNASVFPNAIPYYGYTGGEDVALFKGGIAPVTVYERGSCGGAKKRKNRSNKKRTLRKKSKGRKRRTIKSRRRRRTRRRRGGALAPSSPGLVIPAGRISANNSALANPPPAGRNNFNGKGKCVDNYNHYTGTGN